jgi:hypothetical protein
MADDESAMRRASIAEAEAEAERQRVAEADAERLWRNLTEDQHGDNELQQ